ncbi:hypothetical protein GCM10023322_46320 [Rugosimonospora acidiphila]|uniref:Uncharacterized protein n=1 Tax=Rugosimonospora acidiphila TaxID=556531 RepID=A0ABP9S5I1_9ACTN
MTGTASTGLAVARYEVFGNWSLRNTKRSPSSCARKLTSLALGESPSRTIRPTPDGGAVLVSMVAVTVTLVAPDRSLCRKVPPSAALQMLYPVVTIRYVPPSSVTKPPPGAPADQNGAPYWYAPMDGFGSV